MTARITVFLCGEPHRSDDGAAFRAAALLDAATRERADLVHAGHLDALALLALPTGRPCIVADAVSGIAPGALLVTSLARLADAARHRATRRSTPASRSSHELRVEETLALASVLRATPIAGTFVGIGAAEFGFGENLSADVAAALPAFAAALAAEIGRLAATETLPC